MLVAEPHKPTTELRAKVDALAAFGVPIKKIAKYIGIDFKTLSKHYETELETAGVDKVVQVGNALFQKALDGNVTAQIFFLKTRGGWRETDVDEHDKDEAVNKIQIEVINGHGELKDG